MVNQNTLKKYYLAGYAKGQQTCQCQGEVGLRNTPDQDNFPSYFLQQRNQKLAMGGNEGKLGAYERLWGRSSNSIRRDNRSAAEILFKR
jgi:hypothetical protein